MALLDLSLVTQSLIDLIDTQITNSSAWNPVNMLSVDPYPPDRLTGDNTLGFYLYHVTEDSTGKNTYIPGVSDVPVRYTPMGLNLYYLLTAHSDLDNTNSVYREQLMMGLAMKALHDFPLVDDTTLVAGNLVMHPLLRGADNAFRVSMLPIKQDDSVAYWTAGSSPQRLAAYYHVAVVKLEPEEPRVRAGRVLTYNVFPLPSDAPHAEATENVISFTLPGELDPRALDLRPAQVTYDTPFSVLGSAFTGDRVLLQIRRADWDAPVEVDAAWNVSATSSRISATARTAVSGVDVVPGIYTASVKVERWRMTATGTKILESSSNETPFAIVPEVTTPTVPDPAGRFTVTGRVFQHADIAPEMVQVYVGANRLTQAVNPLNLQPGEYDIPNATTLNVRLSASAVSGDRLGVRIIINGAENAPQWVIVP